jgi:hypothetical protein
MRIFCTPVKAAGATHTHDFLFSLVGGGLIALWGKARVFFSYLQPYE